MFNLMASIQPNKLQTDPVDHFGNRLIFWLALLLAVRLGLLYYSPTDLFFDEAQYWTWSEELAFGYYSKPPLIAWLIGLSTAVCGTSEFCVRLPSPLIHTGTAVIIYWLGRRIYSSQVGFWSALTFATLPAVTLSSSLISTDVPLLFCWALALLAFAELAQINYALNDGLTGPRPSTARSWVPALLLGLALGLGLNAKYAMAFFILCAGIYIALTPSRWPLLRDPRLYLALALGAAMLVPNVLWNIEHGFATISHTADNANWRGPLLHPLKALEFIGAQLGVFGPVLFIGLLFIVWRAWHEGLSDSDQFLATFIAPILVIIIVQALLSRAHANWAAAAYVAATPLVIATLIRRAEWHWLKGSLALHVIAATILGIGTMLAGKLDYPGNRSPFERVLGWKVLADTTQHVLKTAGEPTAPIAAIITNDRAISAELLYYMRDKPIPLYAWRATNSDPGNHYQLTRPFTGISSGPFLLVIKTPIFPQIIRQFEKYRLVAQRKIPAGYGKPRFINFYILSGYLLRGTNPR